MVSQPISSKRKGGKVPEKQTCRPTDLDESYNKALKSVLNLEVRTEQLQSTWRNLLRTISFVVLLVTLYQLHKSTMHYLNEKMDVDYSGSKVVAVGRNSKCEILNVVLGFFTVYFLIFKEPYGSFTSWAYKISFVVALCCVGLFLQSKNIDHKKERNYIENSDNNRNFPVAVIFHAVVTICYMFMNVGMHQCKLNLKMVENLRKDLTMKKNKKTK